MRKITLLLLIVVATHAGAQIINVPADYPTIQQGINAAQPGDTVLVADGTYYERVSITSKKPLLVASHFIMDGDSIHLNNTKLDGSQLSGNLRSVVSFSNVDSTAILAGFTIQNGHGTWYENKWLGGGIFLQNSGAKIIHNKIINNYLNGGPMGDHTDVAGGGIMATGDGDFYWVVVTDNLISNNSCSSDHYTAAGGGVYMNHSNLRFENNILSNNHVSTFQSAVTMGAGLVIAGSDVHARIIAKNNKISDNIGTSQSQSIGSGIITITTDCIIVDNEFSNNKVSGGLELYGSLAITGNTTNSVIENNSFNENLAGKGGAIGIDLFWPDNVLIQNNSFVTNRADFGGAVYANKGKIFLQNNIFHGNMGDLKGGAIYLYSEMAYDVPAIVVNNTFEGNTADLNGGAISTYNSDLLLLNNIFWNDTASSGAEVNVYQGEASIAYCNIDTTKLAGTVSILEGNILHDPLFCDSICLTVFPNSPCLNQGAEYYVFEGSNIVYAPANDIVYKQRPINSFYDMGAYEIDTTTGINDLENALKLALFPNPANNLLYCHYSLEKDSKVAITLYDILGTLKYSSREFRQPAGEHIMPLSMEGLTKGVYLLKLRVNDQVATRKIIKN